MRLKSLHIHGFKSFAKKADLTFNTAITGVVGPSRLNGLLDIIS